MASVAMGHGEDADRDVNAADDALWDAVRASLRDPQAFEPIYRAYAPLIHAYCHRRLGSADRAADATSQVFVNAIRSLPRFRPNERRVVSSFRSWLFAIAHNVVVDLYRRDRPQHSLDAFTADEDSRLRHLADPGHTPEEAALVAEDRDELARVLATLPERQRAVIELRMIGCSRREIAETLGLSEAAVRSIQYRGFTTLRSLLSGMRIDDRAGTVAERER